MSCRSGYECMKCQCHILIKLRVDMGTAVTEEAATMMENAALLTQAGVFKCRWRQRAAAIGDRAPASCALRS